MALASLTPAHRRTLFKMLEPLTDFPAMYPRRQRGRHVGLRYFVLEKRWLVYYRPEATGGILVFAIVPALARPR